MKKSFLANTEEIQQYIRDLKKIPVISHERQEEIFTALINKEITKDEKKKLFDELVVGNLRFVISVAYPEYTQERKTHYGYYYDNKNIYRSF